MRYEWRERKPGEWWMVFLGSPPLGETDERGVSYPPKFTVSFAETDGAVSEVRPCLHLYAWNNGQMPDEPIRDANCEPEYLHVCDLDDVIAELVLLRDTLKANGKL